MIKIFIFFNFYNIKIINLKLLTLNAVLKNNIGLPSRHFHIKKQNKIIRVIFVVAKTKMFLNRYFFITVIHISDEDENTLKYSDNYKIFIDDLIEVK